MFGSAKIPQLQAMVNANGNDELAHWLLGKAYYEEGHYMEAAAEFRRLAELNPDMPDAWQGMGEAYEKAGVRKEAIAAFKQGMHSAKAAGARSTEDQIQDELVRISR